MKHEDSQGIISLDYIRIILLLVFQMFLVKKEAGDLHSVKATGRHSGFDCPRASQNDANDTTKF